MPRITTGCSGRRKAPPLNRSVRRVLSKSKGIVNVTKKEKLRAVNLMTFGIKPLDALHMALAESGNADYFCTCDNKFLRNSKRVKDLTVKVINPVELIWFWRLKNDYRCKTSNRN